MKKKISSASWFNKKRSSLFPRGRLVRQRYERSTLLNTLCHQITCEKSHADCSQVLTLKKTTEHTPLLRFRFSKFRFCFTLSSKCFSSFPHGTCSLSVSHVYLALDGLYHPLQAALPSNSTRCTTKHVRPQFTHRRFSCIEQKHRADTFCGSPYGEGIRSQRDGWGHRTGDRLQLLCANKGFSS